jgi:hypothetical protein
MNIHTSTTQTTGFIQTVHSGAPPTPAKATQPSFHRADQKFVSPRTRCSAEDLLANNMHTSRASASASRASEGLHQRVCMCQGAWNGLTSSAAGRSERLSIWGPQHSNAPSRYANDPFELKIEQRGLPCAIATRDEGQDLVVHGNASMLGRGQENGRV